MAVPFFNQLTGILVNEFDWMNKVFYQVDSIRVRFGLLYCMVGFLLREDEDN